MATVKKATKKVSASTAAEVKPKKGGKGRTSSYTGKKIYRLKKTEETGLRATGFIRDCWNAIRDGISVEKYRENAPDSKKARKALADFVAKGYVKVA